MFLRINERPIGVEPTTDWVGADGALRPQPEYSRVMSLDPKATMYVIRDRTLRIPPRPGRVTVLDPGRIDVQLGESNAPQATIKHGDR
jgi:hypothetical protein